MKLSEDVIMFEYYEDKDIDRNVESLVKLSDGFIKLTDAVCDDCDFVYVKWIYGHLTEGDRVPGTKLKEVIRKWLEWVAVSLRDDPDEGSGVDENEDDSPEDRKLLADCEKHHFYRSASRRIEFNDIDGQMGMQIRIVDIDGREDFRLDIAEIEEPEEEGD